MLNLTLESVPTHMGYLGGSVITMTTGDAAVLSTHILRQDLENPSQIRVIAFRGDDAQPVIPGSGEPQPQRAIFVHDGGAVRPILLAGILSESGSSSRKEKTMSKRNVLRFAAGVCFSCCGAVLANNTGDAGDAAEQLHHIFEDRCQHWIALLRRTIHIAQRH